MSFRPELSFASSWRALKSCGAACGPYESPRVQAGAGICRSDTGAGGECNHAPPLARVIQRLGNPGTLSLQLGPSQAFLGALRRSSPRGACERPCGRSLRLFRNFTPARSLPAHRGADRDGPGGHRNAARRRDGRWHDAGVLRLRAGDGQHRAKRAHGGDALRLHAGGGSASARTVVAVRTAFGPCGRRSPSRGEWSRCGRSPRDARVSSERGPRASPRDDHRKIARPEDAPQPYGRCTAAHCGLRRYARHAVGRARILWTVAVGPVCIPASGPRPSPPFTRSPLSSGLKPPRSPPRVSGAAETLFVARTLRTAAMAVAAIATAVKPARARSTLAAAEAASLTLTTRTAWR